MDVLYHAPTLQKLAPLRSVTDAVEESEGAARAAAASASTWAARERATPPGPARLYLTSSETTTARVASRLSTPSLRHPATLTAVTPSPRHPITPSLRRSVTPSLRHPHRHLPPRLAAGAAPYPPAVTVAARYHDSGDAAGGTGDLCRGCLRAAAATGAGRAVRLGAAHRDLRA